MATVTNTVKLPDGSTPDRVDVVIELVASTTGKAAGWITATDVTLEATVRPTVTNGAWTASLTPNADITPSGSVYKVTEYVDKTRYTHYIEVDSDGGSLFDLLVDPPASVASAALTSHIADTTGAHAASAISVADSGNNLAATTVEAALAELADAAETHLADTSVHGIDDTALLIAETDGTSSSRNVLSGAPANSLSLPAMASGILGGGNGTYPNVIDGTSPALCWIVGGYDNQIHGVLADGIIVSHHSVIESGATHGAIVGGSFLTIGSNVDYAAAVGGTDNDVTADYAAVVAGNQNVASGQSSIVLAGNTNQATGSYSVAAGFSNYAEGNSAVSMGNDNTAVGNGAAAMGGQTVVVGTTATTRGDYAAALGGFQNNLGTTLTARFSGLVGGRSHSVQSEYCAVVGGQEVTLDTATHQSAVGYRVSGKLYAAHHHAAGYFAAAGDAQHIRAVARATTTDANATIMYLDGASQRLNIPASTTWMVEANIVARNTGADEHAAYVLRVCVKRDATTGSTSVLSSDLTALYETQAAWNVTATANTTNGALNINAVGEAGKTIRWVATVSITQVGGA